MQFLLIIEHQMFMKMFTLILLFEIWEFNSRTLSFNNFWGCTWTLAPKIQTFSGNHSCATNLMGLINRRVSQIFPWSAPKILLGLIRSKELSLWSFDVCWHVVDWSWGVRWGNPTITLIRGEKSSISFRFQFPLIAKP